MPEDKVALWRAKWSPKDAFLPGSHTCCRQGSHCKRIWAAFPLTPESVGVRATAY